MNVTTKCALIRRRADLEVEIVQLESTLDPLPETYEHFSPCCQAHNDTLETLSVLYGALADVEQGILEC